jgi:hypothetical protein
LAADESDIHTTRGHINPVSWFYLSHALLSAGFCDLKVTVDKYQRRSHLAFPFAIVPLRAANWIVYHRDKKYVRHARPAECLGCSSDEFAGSAALANVNRYRG